MKRKDSSFTILVIFACLSIIGACLIPLLSIQFTPTRANKSLSVYFGWQDASAKVTEQKVTSKLEGIFNTVGEIKEISSASYKGGGSISMDFKKEANMDAIRFKIASLIRQIYSELPKGVSYPVLSKSSINENSSPIMSYSIHANESPHYIKKFAEGTILPKISEIKGVNKVDVYGAVPFEWVVQYDTEKLFQLNISVDDIRNAIETYFQKRELGTALASSENNSSDQEITLTLVYRYGDQVDWNMIPVKESQNRTIYLKNIAKTKYKEGKLNGYYRVNGLNTVNVVVYAEKGVNTIDIATSVRATIDKLKQNIPIGYDIKITHDTTEFVVKELQKIQKRSLYSFLILLLLILLINRSLKYLAILLFSIITNLLVAVIFYYAFHIQLQLYSFAGITISFGIIIDNSIVMVDHLRNKGDKKVFLAILAATLTTIGALMIIFLLEEAQRLNLWDFALVIAINIGVSLLVSMYYIPALLKKMNLEKKQLHFSRRRKRRISKFTKHYATIINQMLKPRYKWTLIILLILGFGLPIHLLPDKLEGEVMVSKLYNVTLGSEWYNTQLRPTLEKVLGGSLRLFSEDVFENSYYNQPERTSLNVTGRMPDGCTTEQLNEAVLKMENFIGSFHEIALYETRINSSKNSHITIYFKENFELGSFPYTLKSMLESKAISLGGVDWTISGVGRGFSNALGTDHKSNHIVLEGYNYDTLYKYAKLLKEQLESDSGGRVRDVEITSGEWYDSNLNEYFLDFDQEKLVLAKVSQNQLHKYLKNQVHSAMVTSIVRGHEVQEVKLVSDNYQRFNTWDIKNTPILIDHKPYKLHQFATIEKRKTGNSIKKINQQYRLTVAYDFLGTQALAKKTRTQNIEKLGDKLPVGYRVLEQSYDFWNKEDPKQYYYILVVIFVIFFICSILLESLKQPIAIISMIPLSFIGVFLTFYLFEFNFDQGGYASFILLCGISVNAALFIINDYNNLKNNNTQKQTQQLYFKAFNYKIIPILLTIISTIAGLFPFIWDGQNEVFWFSFAVGSIGGLLFSWLGLLFYLPIFTLSRLQCKNSLTGRKHKGILRTWITKH